MYYYRKLMGNGAVASKFRLAPSDEGETAQEAASSSEGKSVSVEPEFESPETHHPNNCNRCYRLKKKCSREKPICSNCSRTHHQCEYVLRTNKKRKKSEPVSSVTTVAPQAQKSHLVSVSSLLAHDGADNSDFKMRQTEKLLKKDTHNNDRMINRAVANAPVEDDEFITIKLPPDLPKVFLFNYFENFEYVYGFINRDQAVQKVDSIDFSHETILDLDLYLLLCIGCVIYDSNNKSHYFGLYFEEKLQSIISEISYTKDNLKNLILLTVYSICALNESLCWNLLGIVIRLIIKHDLYKPSTTEQERMFWTVYVLDKELSLLLSKPSQIPADQFLKLQLPHTKLYHDENTDLVAQHIKFAQFQDKVLALQLVGDCDLTQLTQLSTDLESWRISISSLIHTEYASSPKLQDFISNINLNYYYLLIEIDQLSPSESFQFTLQFLSNSFSLILQEESKQDKVNHNEICINTVFWYNKLFKVIRFNLKSLTSLLGSRSISKLDLSLKLSEFNSNLQLIINLLKYLKANATKQVLSISVLVDKSIAILNQLNLGLMNFNSIVSTEDERTRLSTEVERVNSDYRLLMELK